MIDQLIKLVEKNAGDAIINNKAIPNEFNNSAIQDVAQQIFSGMKGQAGSGNIQDILSMFKGGNSSMASNPMVTQMISGLAGNFASRFGISPQTAQGLVSGLLPAVMDQFVNKTNDPDDNDFDLQDIMRNVSGNDSLNLSDLIGAVGGSSPSNADSLGSTLSKIFS